MLLLVALKSVVRPMHGLHMYEGGLKERSGWACDALDYLVQNGGSAQCPGEF